jgi:hypothetical protein
MERYYCLTQAILFLLLAGLADNVIGAEEIQLHFDPGIELPQSEGRALILRACTNCHTLEGVPAFQKYWGYERWLPMVENMIEHGARLDAEEKVVVTRYLAKYFGTD